MNEIERETTIASLQKLCARLETLRHLDIADLQLPEQQKHYEQTLEDAYAALAQVETALDTLGQELEYQHQRLGEVRNQRTGG
jgi:peptidoglycan hydrolase CwlO-like protein